MESHKINLAPTLAAAPRLCVAAGVFLIFGVVFGALGAHAMERVLDSDGVDAFVTASHYLLFMGSGILGALASGQKRGLSWVVWGTVLFSGSIFGLLFGKAAGFSVSILGPITPMGGVLMIAGWTRWTWSFFRRSR